MRYLMGFLVACSAVMIYLMETAPEGYEDENGFHYGPEPFDKKDLFKEQQDKD